MAVINGNAGLALLVVNGIRVPAACFWHAEVGNNGAEQLQGEEDPQDTAETNGAGVLLVVRLGPVVEPDTRQNGTELTNGSAETVGETTHTRWEHFAGNDEGGGVGSEVEEELGDDDEGKASA